MSGSRTTQPDAAGRHTVAGSYAEWISAYRERTPILLGKCAAATTEMVAAFPELRRVAGHVYVLGWGRRAHWWCETEDGTIVDPTEAQFPCVAEYERWVPGTEIRVGRCMNCGEDIMSTPTDLANPHEGVRSLNFCTDQCSEDMAKEVGW